MASYIVILEVIGGFVGGWLLARLIDVLQGSSRSPQELRKGCWMTAILGALSGSAGPIRLASLSGGFKLLVEGIVNGYFMAWAFVSWILVVGSIMYRLSERSPSRSDAGSDIVKPSAPVKTPRASAAKVVSR